MQPYVFFDVAKGREKRREGGGSVSNRVRMCMQGSCTAAAGVVHFLNQLAACHAGHHTTRVRVLSLAACLQEEALMAACLFAELRAFLIAKAQAQPGSIKGPTTGAHWPSVACALPLRAAMHRCSCGQ